MENERILLASPHMSDEGYEQEYVKARHSKPTGLLRLVQMSITLKKLAEYVGIEHAAALTSGTS